jgi:hypothetical protein
MENREVNKKISSLWREFKAMRKNAEDDESFDYYKAEEALRKQIVSVFTVVGAVEVMSKSNIIKLCSMQATLRFVPEHRFYAPFRRAAEDLNF